MRLRRTAAVTAIAILCEAVSWRDLEPDGLAAALYVLAGVGFFWFAATARWRELPLFLIVFALAAVVERVAFYDPPPAEYCDPFCSGPTTLLVFEPFVLLLLMLPGMLFGRVLRDLRERRSR